MDNVIKYSNFIKRIFDTSSASIRKSMLQSSNDDIIKAISEVLLNIYHKNIVISKHSLKSMKRVKRAVLKIINKKTTASHRKELLITNSEALLGIQEVFK